jgi:hypothetical protein
MTNAGLAVLLLMVCGGTTNAAPTPQEAWDAELEKTYGKVWVGRAELEPVGRARQSAATFEFLELEREGTSIIANTWFENLAPGRYRLVIHEGTCARVERPWRAANPVDFDVARLVAERKVAAGAMWSEELFSMLHVDVPFHLHGRDTVIGHTLVLYDRKGTALACGAIEAFEDARHSFDWTFRRIVFRKSTR